MDEPHQKVSSPKVAWTFPAGLYARHCSCYFVCLCLEERVRRKEVNGIVAIPRRVDQLGPFTAALLDIRPMHAYVHACVCVGINHADAPAVECCSAVSWC